LSTASSSTSGVESSAFFGLRSSSGISLITSTSNPSGISLLISVVLPKNLSSWDWGTVSGIFGSSLIISVFYSLLL
jgi:hypothetical protein